MKQFDIMADLEAIKQGGFFCEACLTGKSRGYESPDPRYCQECYDLLNADKKATELPPDSWSKDGFVFNHYGKKYMVTANGGTVCCPGAITETPPDGGEGLPDGGEVVTKIEDKEILPPADIQAQETGIMIQGKGRGRPRKDDGETVSRMTAWRRKHETERQGVLL